MKALADSPSRRAGRNLMAFLDAFKAIGSLETPSSPYTRVPAKPRLTCLEDFA
jgi:hypothetical protein